MRTPLAHSARKNYPPQTYEAHVRGVCERAGKYAAEAECYSVKANGILSAIVRDSTLLHDLGKLEERNQSVLREQSRRRRHLPVDHTDAGSAALQKMGSGCAAMLVYSHHQGLPDLSTEFVARGCSIFRNGNAEVRAETDAALPALLRQHEALFPRKPNSAVTGWSVSIQSEPNLADGFHNKKGRSSISKLRPNISIYSIGIINKIVHEFL